jgi:hypothetical protein
MKNYSISIISLILTLTLFSSCEKEGFYYQDVDRVRIEGPYKWAVNTDSLEFSFITTPSGINQIEMEITVYVMGFAADKDRVVKIGINSSKTTATSSHFSCPLQVTVPAKSLSATFPVLLKRTSDLQQNTVRLYVELEESSDFKVGVAERDHLLIKWNDILSMPKNWSELEQFFGSFSLVKYRFMINNTGITEFSATTMSWAQLMNYKIILRNALDEYNAANPGNPLKDENGQFVTF